MNVGSTEGLGATPWMASRSALGTSSQGVSDHSVGGTPDEVRAEVGAALDATGGRGVLIGPGCSIPPESPRANIAAAREADEGDARITIVRGDALDVPLAETRAALELASCLLVTTSSRHTEALATAAEADDGPGGEPAQPEGESYCYGDSA